MSWSGRINDLERLRLEQAYFDAADAVLASNEPQVFTINGVDVVAVPDVVYLEMLIAGEPEPPPTPTLVRADGRTVRFYRAPEMDR